MLLLHCVCGFYSIVIFFITMVSFGSALPEKNQSDGVPNPEPSQPILATIFQAVLMAMEKHTYGREKKNKEI